MCQLILCLIRVKLLSYSRWPPTSMLSMWGLEENTVRSRKPCSRATNTPDRAATQVASNAVLRDSKHCMDHHSPKLESWTTTPSRCRAAASISPHRIDPALCSPDKCSHFRTCKLPCYRRDRANEPSSWLGFDESKSCTELPIELIQLTSRKSLCLTHEFPG